MAKKTNDDITNPPRNMGQNIPASEKHLKKIADTLSTSGKTLTAVKDKITISNTKLERVITVLAKQVSNRIDVVKDGMLISSVETNRNLRKIISLLNTKPTVSSVNQNTRNESKISDNKEGSKTKSRSLSSIGLRQEKLLDKILASINSLEGSAKSKPTPLKRPRKSKSTNPKQPSILEPFNTESPNINRPSTTRRRNIPSLNPPPPSEKFLNGGSFTNPLSPKNNPLLTSLSTINAVRQDNINRKGLGGGNNGSISLKKSKNITPRSMVSFDGTHITTQGSGSLTSKDLPFQSKQRTRILENINSKVRSKRLTKKELVTRRIPKEQRLKPPKRIRDASRILESAGPINPIIRRDTSLAIIPQPLDINVDPSIDQDNVRVKTVENLNNRPKKMGGVKPKGTSATTNKRKVSDVTVLTEISAKLGPTKSPWLKQILAKNGSGGGVGSGGVGVGKSKEIKTAKKTRSNTKMLTAAGVAIGLMIKPIGFIIKTFEDALDLGKVDEKEKKVRKKIDQNAETLRFKSRIATDKAKFGKTREEKNLLEFRQQKIEKIARFETGNSGTKSERQRAKFKKGRKFLKDNGGFFGANFGNKGDVSRAARLADIQDKFKLIQANRLIKGDRKLSGISGTIGPSPTKKQKAIKQDRTTKFSIDKSKRDTKSDTSFDDDYINSEIKDVIKTNIFNDQQILKRLEKNGGSKDQIKATKESLQTSIKEAIDFNKNHKNSRPIKIPSSIKRPDKDIINKMNGVKKSVRGGGDTLSKTTTTTQIINNSTTNTNTSTFNNEISRKDDKIASITR